MARRGVAWHGLAGHGGAGRGGARYGIAWLGTVWYGVGWRDVTLRQPFAPCSFSYGGPSHRTPRQAPSWEPGPGAWGSAAAWGAGASAGPPGSLLAPAGGLGGPFVSDPAASHGRLVDVKPGELRGAASGGFAFGGLGGFGSGFGGGSGMDWSSTAPAGGSSWGLGSWMSPVPSAHAGQTGLTGMLPSLAGLGGFGLGQSAGGVLPTEADLTDTYAALGVELQHWTPALAAFVDREIVVPLVQALEESDQVWQQALASKGWRLTLDAPRLAMAGFGPTSQEPCRLASSSLAQSSTAFVQSSYF